MRSEDELRGGNRQSPIRTDSTHSTRGTVFPHLPTALPKPRPAPPALFAVCSARLGSEISRKRLRDSTCPVRRLAAAPLPSRRHLTECRPHSVLSKRTTGPYLADYSRIWCVESIALRTDPNSFQTQRQLLHFTPLQQLVCSDSRTPRLNSTGVRHQRMQKLIQLTIQFDSLGLHLPDTNTRLDKKESSRNLCLGAETKNWSSRIFS